MNSFNEKLDFKNILESDLPLEAKVNVLFDILKNVLDEGAIRARTVRFKLQKYINSTDINERIYALNFIASDVNGAKVVGSMPNRGAQHLKIGKLDTPVTIQGGYHDGSGDAAVDSVEAAKIIPKNIREGITILGVTGNMSGSEGMKPQAKNVTPTFEAQVISPDEGYNCLSEVTVAAIPYSEVDNDFGGKTLTIGG